MGEIKNFDMILCRGAMRNISRTFVSYLLLFQETVNSSNLNMYGNNVNSNAMSYQYGQQLAGTEQQNYSNYSNYPQQQQQPTEQPQPQNNGESNYSNTSTTNSNISGRKLW
jgi:hypothetical protein